MELLLAIIAVVGCTAAWWYRAQLFATIERHRRELRKLRSVTGS